MPETPPNPKGGSSKPSRDCRVRVMSPDSPYKNRKDITPTSGGRTMGNTAAEAKKDRPGNSYRLKIKASGTPTKPLRSTLKTEMYRLFQRASRLVNASGEKNCR